MLQLSHTRKANWSSWSGLLASGYPIIEAGRKVVGGFLLVFWGLWIHFLDWRFENIQILLCEPQSHLVEGAFKKNIYEFFSKQNAFSIDANCDCKRKKLEKSRNSITVVPYLLTSLFIPRSNRDETRIKPKSERFDLGG